MTHAQFNVIFIYLFIYLFIIAIHFRECDCENYVIVLKIILFYFNTEN